MHKVLLAAIIAFGGLQSLPGQAVLAGRVLHEGLSSPIAGARVSLARFSPDLPLTDATRDAVGYFAASLQNPRTPPAALKGLLAGTAFGLGVSMELLEPVYMVSAVTDDSGNFRFAELVPGRYVLAIERDGHFVHEGEARNAETMVRIITIEAGVQPARLDLFMVEGGSISGRIRDPLGQPGAKLIVGAYRPHYQDGVLSWKSDVGALTDDRGEFRLSGPPPGPTNLKWEDSWARTFYPGSDYLLGAVPLTVDFGQEVRAINIDIVKVDPGRTYTISGTAINPLSTLRPNSTTGIVDRSVENFYLVSREPSLLYEFNPSVAVRNAIPAGSRPKGEFEIRNVKPGAYDLYAASGDRSFIGRTTVNVLDQDVTGLSIAISPGGTLETQVVIEGSADPPIRLESLQMEISKTDTTPISIPSGRKFDASGRVVFLNFPEAHYRFSLEGLPTDAYIADIQQSGRSVYDEGIVVRPQLEPVRISVKTDSGAVTGSVEKSGKGVPKATVILVPPATRRKNPQLFRTVTTGEEGRFSVRGVMPGVYRILALRSLPPGEPWLNEAFLAPFLQRAQELRIDARSTVPVRLELIAN
jgi:hypothetical protein